MKGICSLKKKLLEYMTVLKTLGKDKETVILAKSFLKAFPALTKISEEEIYNQKHS